MKAKPGADDAKDIRIHIGELQGAAEKAAKEAASPAGVAARQIKSLDGAVFVCPKDYWISYEYEFHGAEVRQIAICMADCGHRSPGDRWVRDIFTPKGLQWSVSDHNASWTVSADGEQLTWIYDVAYRLEGEEDYSHYRPRKILCSRKK